MKITDTISVNPSKTALGHVENSTSSIFRSPVIGADAQSHSFDILTILFPSCASTHREFRKYEVPLRTVFATILIVSGITLLQAASSIALAVCSLCFGAFLMLGLFTRPVMFGAAVYYCITGALALRYGHADFSIFSLMFGCLVFAIMGGGKYSCDNLIRGAIRRFKTNSMSLKKEDMEKEPYLGYKAFHKVRI